MSAPREALRPRDRSEAWSGPATAGYREAPVRGATAASARDGSLAPGVTLTGAGAIVLLVVAGVIGAVIDLVIGPGLGTATVILLAVGALAATWLVRRRALGTVAIAPPLVYLLLAVGALIVKSDLGVTMTGLATSLVYGFPAMAIASAISVVIASIRQITGR